MSDSTVFELVSDSTARYRKQVLTYQSSTPQTRSLGPLLTSSPSPLLSFDRENRYVEHNLTTGVN